MPLLRLYNDDKSASPTSTVPRPSTLLRLYADTPTGARQTKALTKPVSTILTTGALPQSYATQPLYGASNRADSSGKPFVTFRNDKIGQSQLLTDRVATGFDPTVPRVWTRKDLTNGRMPTSISQRIRKELGATVGDDTELDHAIALELSGSNQRSNLSLIEGRAKPGRAFQLNQLMNSLARRVIKERSAFSTLSEQRSRRREKNSLKIRRVTS